MVSEVVWRGRFVYSLRSERTERKVSEIDGMIGREVVKTYLDRVDID